MWFITHTSSGSRFYFTGDKSSYNVGRLGADLELQADICVSRSHAAFHVAANKIELEDLGSKYGTFHNKGIEENTTLEKGRKVKLKCNDLIRFGRLQNVWTVEKLTINTVTSSLTEVDVDQVTAFVEAIGGKVIGQWSSNCTHLTMKEPSVTVKLLHALVDQKCVVTPNYWKDLAAAVASRKSCLPKAELYCPDFGDAKVDVRCKLERRQLFKGSTFVFLSRKHFDMYGPIVKAAGGYCKDINSGVQKTFLIKNNVVVVQYNPSTQSQSSQTINTIAEFLESHSKRIVPEYEIGLAILNCSLEEFCNPNYKMTDSMAQSVPHVNPDNSMIVDLTDGDSTPSINTQDFVIQGTNRGKIVTSTPYENPVPCASSYDPEDNQETMPNIHITETPGGDKNIKRKHDLVKSTDMEESDGDDLFQFAKKSKNVKQQAETVEKESSSEKATNQKKQNKKVNENPRISEENSTENNAKSAEPSDVENEKRISTRSRSIKKSAFADFLEKPQNKNKPKALSPEKLIEDISCSTSRSTRKRPRIQILGGDDDEGEADDLFCFSDTQSNNKKRCDKPNNKNSDNEQDEEDDLFGFKEKQPKTGKQLHTIAVDNDGSDLQATDELSVAPKPVKSAAKIIPKPKILPRKISAVDWISGSLGKIKIKSDVSSNVKSENVLKSESDVKPNIDEIEMTEDHRQWLDSLKNAVEVKKFSFNFISKLNQTSTHDNSDGSITNYKKFVKKYCSSKTSTVVQLHSR